MKHFLVLLYLAPCLACAEPAPAPVAAAAGAPLDLFTDVKPWVLPNPTAWKWSGEGVERELHLVAQSRLVPKYRSPFNLAWFGQHEWKDFTLNAEVRLTKFDKSNNDLCIAFGRASENRFYYAHLGVRADNVHHQIHIVDEADRRPITASRTDGTHWKPGVWHHLKLVRNTASGEISVYFDDMEKPVLTANDKTLGWGQIGLGSFDDLGEFRKVLVSGLSRQTPLE